METKNATKTDKLKLEKSKNEVVKKKKSKIMKAVEKYKGSVEILDMDALFKPVYWYEVFIRHQYISISYFR